MHAKRHHIGGCYNSIGVKNCALSLRKRLVEQISGVQIGVYRKRYIRVFVNHCKPQAASSTLHVPGIAYKAHARIATIVKYKFNSQVAAK